MLMRKFCVEYSQNPILHPMGAELQTPKLPENMRAALPSPDEIATIISGIDADIMGMEEETEGLGYE